MGNVVGIVGGGAAGMAAAIAAAHQGAEVVLLERNDRLGKKILSTGNGRCNLGNEKLGVDEYYTGNPDFLKNCLERFGTGDTIAFFRGIGLMIKSKNGYLYPACEQAAVVLDVLRHEVAALGVEVITDCRAESIEKERKSGNIRVCGNGKSFKFDHVVLACGGQAAPKTGSDGSGFTLAKQLGHSLTPMVPALVQLRCREDYFKAVQGVRADAEVAVWHRGKCMAKERGELQLTDYGISGIPVFQLSRVVNYILLEEKEVEIAINLLPDFTQEDLEQLIRLREPLREKLFMKGKHSMEERHSSVEEYFTGMLHKKLMGLFIRLAGLKPAEDAAKADERKLCRVYELCRSWTVHVNGSNSYDNAQVCAGGVPLSQVTEDLESRKVPGVYFAGEILDVDGKCGGYNLQWAWCSGHLAGQAAGRQQTGGRESQ